LKRRRFGVWKSPQEVEKDQSPEAPTVQSNLEKKPKNNKTGPEPLGVRKDGWKGGKRDRKDSEH